MTKKLRLVATIEPDGKDFIETEKMAIALIGEFVSRLPESAKINHRISIERMVDLDDEIPF